MTKSTEIFFYDMLNNISAAAAAAAVPVDTLNTFRRQAIARFFTIFASKHSRGLDRITVETNPAARHAVYDLIISVNKNTANNNALSQLISEAVTKAEVPFLVTVAVAPESKVMTRGQEPLVPTVYTSQTLCDNYGAVDSNDYNGKLKNFLIDKSLITNALHSVNSEYSLLSQAELVPGTANNNHSSNLTSAPSSSYNQTVCCNSCYCDDCCYCPVSSSYDNYGYDYGYNDNECSSIVIANCCSDMFQCMGTLCRDVFCGLEQCCETFCHCCVSDICTPVRTIIGNCSCNECSPSCSECNDCGDCGKEISTCLCIPCIFLYGAVDKLIGNSSAPSTTTPSPSPSPSTTTAAPRGLQHRFLRSFTTNPTAPSAAIDGCTQWMNHIAHWIDSTMSDNSIFQFSSSDAMQGGLRTSASTACCIGASAILFCHVSRRLMDLRKLLCQRPDDIQRGNLNRNLLSLCFIGGCCAAGLLKVNPYHSYRTATFLASMATWFCNRVDISASGEGGFGYKSANGFCGHHDVTAQIAKLKKIFTEGYTQNQWQNEVQRLVNNQYNDSKTQQRLGTLSQTINSFRNRVDEASKDGWVRCIPTQLAKICLQTTALHNDGCFSYSKLMGGFLDCLDWMTCHTSSEQGQPLNSVQTNVIAQHLPRGSDCCGLTTKSKAP